MKKAKKTPSEVGIAHEIAGLTLRAIDADRPLFLIVYYEHEAVKFSFIKALQQALRAVKLSSRTFDPAHRPEHGAGKLFGLLGEGEPSKALAIIAGLHRLPGSSAPDPTFLEYLNLHRDRIASDRLRFILFLHTAEAEGFITGAGDLWDFRHHTYWLEGRPEAERSLWRSPDQFPDIRLSDEDRATVQKHLEDVRSLIRETADPEEKAALYLDLGRWLRKRYLPGPGAEAVLEGLELISPPSSRLSADLEHELAYALREDHNFPDALSHYLKSLAISREIGDRSGEGTTLNNISQIYDAWGRYEEALKALEESLAICREIGDRFGEAVTHNNIAGIYRAWGRYDEALKALEESLAIWRKIGDRSGEGTTFSNIAAIYHAWGRYDEALKALEESLAIFREIGNRSGEGTTLNNISQIYAAWGRNEEALKALEESLAIRREIGDRSGEGTTLNNISQIYAAWGRYEETLTALEESLAIHREIGDRSGEAVTCWNLATEYERMGDVGKAIDFARRTVQIEEETHHPDLEKDRAYLKALEETLSRTKNPL